MALCKMALFWIVHLNQISAISKFGEAAFNAVAQIIYEDAIQGTSTCDRLPVQVKNADNPLSVSHDPTSNPSHRPPILSASCLGEDCG